MAKKVTKKSAPKATPSEEVERLRAEVGETEFTLQMDLASRLLKLLDMLQRKMDDPSFEVMRMVESSQGTREEAHPLINIYLNAVSKTQSAIKALGRNYDSKASKVTIEETENNALANIMDKMSQFADDD